MSSMIEQIITMFGLESNSLSIDGLLCIFFFVLSFTMISELVCCLWRWFKR